MESSSITVDSSPPRIGTFEVKNAGLDLSPNNAGFVKTLEHSSATFSVSLEHDTERASLFIGDDVLPLTKNIATGLWEASFTTGASGTTPIAISAEDAVHNRIERKSIGTITSVFRGTVVVRPDDQTTVPLQGASIEVLVWNEDGVYVPFDAPGFKIDTDYLTDADGHYELALPQGTYLIKMRKPGYATIDQMIELSGPAVVAESFETRELSGWQTWVQKVTDIFTH
jgi:hypothetical protein